MREAIEEAGPEELDARESEARTAQWRAERAKAILEDELVVEAFKDIEAVLLGEFKLCGFHETARMASISQAIKTVEKFRAALGKHLRGGKVAAAEIVQIDQRRKWLEKLRA